MQLIEGEPLVLGHGYFTGLGFAVDDDLFGFGRVGDALEGIARFRQRLEAEHFDRHGRLHFPHRLSAVVQHGAHLAEYQSADAEHQSTDEIVADTQCAVSDQHRRHRSAAAVELGFENRAHGGTVRIGLKVLQVRHQQNHFQQKVEIRFLLGRDVHHDRVAAPFLGVQAGVGELLLDALRLGVGLIDLVDRDDDGNTRGARMVDGFERLRHDAVVGRHHQHHDVGDFGAARTHARERFVAGRVDEHDFAPVLLDVISADVLGDAARFLFGDIGDANGVE